MKDNIKSKELLVEEWLKRAYDDELNARSILVHKDGAPNGPCFLSQQMAEKYLKAYLVFRKKRFPRIHALDNLLELCMEMDSSFSKLKKDAIFLNKFLVATRYPGDYPEFSWKDAKEAYDAAVRVKDFVLEKVK